MSIPMQISIPLALHLSSPITYNFVTNERWKMGEKFVESRTLQDFAFIDQRSGRFDATIQFGAFFRLLYEHQDWSQLYHFFSARYSKFSIFTDSGSRILVAPPDSYQAGKSATVHFNTEPTIVGLPQGFPKSLGDITRKAVGGILGADPLNCSIGPAISVGIGAGGYMDLIYAENPPGAYPASLLGSNEGSGANSCNRSSSIANIKKGGRGRSLAEWHELWSAMAEWIYEHDSTMIEYVWYHTHSYKYRLSDEESAEAFASRKMARKYLQTDAIHAADGIRDMFAQLAADPVKFQGLEWDFLKLETPAAVEEAFTKRFGTRGVDRVRNFEELARDISLGPDSWRRLTYDDVSPVHLKPCPDSYRGVDWEGWLLSIRGGDVVVVKTVFQALWAVMLLTQLPLTISITDQDGKFPRFTDPEMVYL